MFLLAPLAWALLAQAPPTSTLTGVVVDPAGAPMAGAEVWWADRPRPDEPKPPGPVKADDEGRFSIRMPAGAKAGGASLSLALWAYAPGHRLGLMPLESELLAPGEAIRIEVGPPAKAIVRLEPPNSSVPVKGKVEVFSVQRRAGSMPRSLIERLGVPIGDDGIATLDGFDPEDIQGIDVRTEVFGTQTRQYYPPVAGDRTIRLRPVGHVFGKIVLDDPSKLKDWKVTAWTTPDDEPGYTSSVGNYWTDTDEQGRFDFSTLATGTLVLTARPPAGLNYLADQVRGRKVEAGAKIEVDVPTLRGVIVEGFVREVGTGAPMPGVWISLFPKEHFVGGLSELTDEKGHYSKAVWPGQLTMHAAGGPPTHLLPPKTTSRTFEVPAGVERFELPTIEMTRGESIRGVVVDAQGKPVTNAAVEVRYKGDDEGDATLARAKTRSNRAGAFLIQGITPGAEVKLSAKKVGESTAQAVTTKAGAEAPVTLKLGPSDAIALKGKILGPDGQPLAGALVLLKSKVMGTGPPSWNETKVTLEGVETVRSGADGAFETPQELDPKLLYRAEVVAIGMARAQTNWATSPSTRFADLTLRRARALRSVVGQVVDRAGEPVAGVMVFQSGDGPRRTSSVTDAGGRFRVDGILDDRAFLFSSRDRFRFQAQPIGPGVSNVEIVLTRESEQPSRARPQTFSMTRAEEKALARQLVALARARTSTRPDDRGDGARLLALEARLDPNRMIELIQNQVVRADSELANVALGLIEDEPGEALGLIESNRRDAGALADYLTVFDALAPSRVALRREVLARAERRARAALSPDPSAGMNEPWQGLAKVAVHWVELGERDRAISVFREARTASEAPSDRRIAWFGLDPMVKVLASLDLPAALAIIDRESISKASNVGSFDQSLAEVAERAARVDPAVAERLLRQISQDHTRKDVTRAVCFVMAAHDLERARRLAAPLGELNLPPQLDAIAARARVATNPREARALLDSAFRQFERIAEGPVDRPAHKEVAASMAMCLSVVARIDPTLVPEYLARCLAARPGRSVEPDRESIPQASLLAMLLARYDREAAEIVFERVPEGLNAPTTNPFQANATLAVIKEAAAIDPRAALAIVDRMPDDPTGAVDTRWGNDRRKLDARLALATALSRPLDRRRIEAVQSNSRNWPIELLD
jgi:protocatechuate 3,4-dioxygenase beta subunit